MSAEEHLRSREANRGKLRSLFSHEITRFLIVGGCAAAANFFTRILLSLWLPFSAAIVASFFVGLGIAFVLNKKFVFAHANNHWVEQFARFLSVNLLALVQTFLVSMALAKFILPKLGVTWHVQEIAHATGIAVPLVTSYVAHRHWSFRST